MPVFNYSVAPFLPFTKIVSADVNQDFADIKTFLNTTKLDTTNVQLNGLNRNRLALGTPNYAVFNDNTGNLAEAVSLPLAQGGLGFTPSLAGGAGKAIVVNDSETALSLGSPLQSSLTQSFVSDITTLTAGEAIAIRDAVCLDLSLDGSNNNIYRVFKADNSKPNRRNSFLGFAVAAATVTAGTYTWVASSNFVTSNAIAFTINGRAYAVNFNTNNATTLQDVATMIATDPDVNGAVSDGLHTVTVTGRGALFLNITGSVVTGGASQPTITVTNTAAPVGQNVRIRNFGDLIGFTITTGLNYYLDTSGDITASPSDGAPIFVGQALSADTLFINRNVGQFQFTTPSIFMRSHGSSTGASAGAQQDVEHFNFSSWSAGNSSGAGKRTVANTSDNSYAGFLMQLDGLDASGTVAPLFQRYNKSSWSTLTNRTNARYRHSALSFSGYFYSCSGTLGSGSDTGEITKWNGASWAIPAATVQAEAGRGAFHVGSLLSILAGGSGPSNRHDTINSSDVSATSTNVPVSNFISGGTNSPGGQGFVVQDTTANAYQWDGASWSSVLTVSYTITGNTGQGGASAFYTGGQMSYLNGGSTNVPAALNTTSKFNGAAFSSDTASTNSRAAANAGVT